MRAHGRMTVAILTALSEFFQCDGRLRCRGTIFIPLIEG
jgi:hypothetical protein